MSISKKTLLALICLALLSSLVMGQEKYLTLGETEAALQDVATKNPKLVKLFSIGKSFGGKDIWVMRIAAPGKVDPDARQAIFIAANIEGYRYLATEACLRTINYLLKNQQEKEIAGMLSTRTYYLAPMLNPDVLVRLESRPVYPYPGNARKVNDDLDLQADEDGPDDLNGDGIISCMRYKDPEGDMMVDPSDERLMKVADVHKGEKGEYKLLVEGIDNDKDGSINEDGPGSAVINKNFPHDFQYYAEGAGQWPASEPETVALIKFLLERKNIGLVYLYGAENTLLNPGKVKKNQGGKNNTLRVPPRYARFMGLDPSRPYPVDELIAIFKERGFGRGEVTADRLKIMFGGGPAKTISTSDLPYFTSLSKEFKNFLEEKKIDDPKRKAKPMSGKGSFSSWVYFQHGIPSVTVDLWAVSKEENGKKKEESVAKAEKSHKSQVMDWAEGLKKGSGFLPWQKYQHPQLGEVEIGGMMPLLEEKPPLNGMDALLAGNVEFAVKMADKLPEVEIVHFEAEKLSQGVYQITAIIGNKSFLPTSMAQGQLNGKVYPTVVKLDVENKNIIHGNYMVKIPVIKGYGRSEKMRWVVSAKAGDSISLDVKTLKAGNAQAKITLK